MFLILYLHTSTSYHFHDVRFLLLSESFLSKSIFLPSSHSRSIFYFLRVSQLFQSKTLHNLSHEALSLLVRGDKLKILFRSPAICIIIRHSRTSKKISPLWSPQWKGREVLVGFCNNLSELRGREGGGE